MEHDHLEEVRLRIVSALECLRFGYHGAEHDLQRALEELALAQKLVLPADDPPTHPKEEAGEPVAWVRSKFGDPEAFGEREIEANDKLVQALPYNTPLFSAPPAPADTEIREALDKLKREYRPSMNFDVLHSWAKDVVAALNGGKHG